MSDEKKLMNKDLDQNDEMKDLNTEEMADTPEEAAIRKRRNIVKGVAAAGGLAAFAVGYSNTAKNMAIGLVKERQKSRQSMRSMVMR